MIELVMCSKERSWEYRCRSCGQLRLFPSEEKPKTCGNCKSDNILIARPGALPVVAAEAVEQKR